MTPPKSKSGYAFIELAVAGAVAGTAMLGLVSAQGLLSKQSGSLQVVADSISEHQSINNFVTGIPLREALSVFCLPHPWGYYTKNTKGSDACISLEAATLWPNRTDGMPGPGPYRPMQWGNLSAAYQLFVRGVSAQNELTPLGGKYLTQETVAWENPTTGIRGRLTDAGCMQCHNGSYSGLRNFGSYSAMLQSPTLVSRYGLGSKMGRYLLPTTGVQILSGGRDPMPEQTVKREHEIQFFKRYRSISTGTTVSNTFKCEAMDLTGSRHAGYCGQVYCGPNCFYRQYGGTYNVCAGGKKDGFDCHCEQYYKCLCPKPGLTAASVTCDSGYVPNGIFYPAVQSPDARFALCESISQLSNVSGYSYWECTPIASETVYQIDPVTNEPILSAANRNTMQTRWSVEYKITTRWWTRGNVSESFDYSPDSSKPGPNRVISFGALK